MKLFVTNRISNLNDPVYTVKTIFGQEEQHLEVFARNLTENIHKAVKSDQKKPVLVSIGLPKANQTDFKLLKKFENKLLESVRDTFTLTQ